MSYSNEYGFCKEKCVFGDEGHCSRTEYDHYCHCNKRHFNDEPQRGKPTLKDVAENLCGQSK